MTLLMSLIARLPDAIVARLHRTGARATAPRTESEAVAEKLAR